MREPELSNTMKYIVQPRKINKTEDIDIHNVENISKSITENEKIRLNHYPIQSVEFFEKVKMTRGDVASRDWDNIRDMNYFYKYDENKTMKDETLANM